MNISRTRHFKVSMGNYENYQFGATVTMSHSDLGYSDEDWTARCKEDGHDTMSQELTRAVLLELQRQLVAEVNDAADLTDDRKAFILRSLQHASAPAKKTLAKRKAR